MRSLCKKYCILGNKYMRRRVEAWILKLIKTDNTHNISSNKDFKNRGFFRNYRRRDSYDLQK